MPGPVSIQHVAVNVPDEDLLGEVESFYIRLGGVPIVRPPMLEQDTPGRWLGFGPTQLHLLVGEPLPRGAHFALHLGERYDEILISLDLAGVKIRTARRLWGARRSFIQDPGGNQIELFEHPPPSNPLP